MNTVQLTQLIFGIGLIAIATSHLVVTFSHNKKITDLATKVEDIGQKMEQDAPQIASAIVGTGLVSEVKPQ